MKKAVNWLQQHQIGYVFHNYHSSGIALAQLEQWATKMDLNDLINRRSLTYRHLAAAEKMALETQEGIIACLIQYPTLIKRPLLTDGRRLLIGFNAENYAAFTQC